MSVNAGQFLLTVDRCQTIRESFLDDSPGIAAQNHTPRRRLLIDTINDDFCCMPHHLTVAGDKHRIMIAALRYYDTFVKMDGSWLFAEACSTLTGSRSARCR